MSNEKDMPLNDYKRGQDAMRIFVVFVMLVLPIILTGCLATKVVTVPMRVAGEIVGCVPVIGGVAESAIDTSASVVDLAPL